MAIIYIGHTGSGGATGVEPTGTKQNDIVIATVMSTSSSIASPAGWTIVGTVLTANGYTAGTWWIKRGASAPSYTWSNMAGANDGFTIITLRGTPGPDSTATGSAGSAVAPSVTAGTSYNLLACFYNDASSTTITMPSGLTIVSGYLSAIGYQFLSASGATGTKTFGGTSLPIGAWSMSFPPTSVVTSVLPTITGTSTVIAGPSGTVVNTSTATSTVSASAVLGYGFASTTATNFLNILRNTSYAGIANVYVQLHTGTPGSAGTNNISLNITRNAITWNAPSNGSMTLATLGSWTMGASETISYVSLWTASTSGTYLWSGSLASPVNVINGTILTLSVFTVGFTPIAA